MRREGARLQDSDAIDNPFAGIETHFLSNGLKVWYKRTPDEPDIYVSVIVPYGSDSDFRGKEQIAHFVEHMLFSDHMGRTEEEIKREIDRLRGSLTSALDLRGMLDPTREPPAPPPPAERRSPDPEVGKGDPPS